MASSLGNQIPNLGACELCHLGGGWCCCSGEEQDEGPPLPQEDGGDEEDAVGADSSAGREDNDTRIVIFTSGTTGKPKGVALPYRSFACNRATFDLFLEIDDSSSTS